MGFDMKKLTVSEMKSTGGALLDNSTRQRPFYAGTGEFGLGGSYNDYKPSDTAHEQAIPVDMDGKNPFAPFREPR